MGILHSHYYYHGPPWRWDPSSRSTCSYRNITWQYIANDGNIPELYIHHCKDVANALASNACHNGECPDTSRFNDNFRFYKLNNWDGLGDPHKAREKLLLLKMKELEEQKNTPVALLMWKAKNSTSVDELKGQNNTTVESSAGKFSNSTNVKKRDLQISFPNKNMPPSRPPNHRGQIMFDPLPWMHHHHAQQSIAPVYANDDVFTSSTAMILIIFAVFMGISFAGWFKKRAQNKRRRPVYDMAQNMGRV